MKVEEIERGIKRYQLDSKDEWLKARKNQIGGSDAAAVLGMSPYKTNVELWEEKTGQKQSIDISDRSYVVYGTKAEKALRELFVLDFPEYQVEYYDDNLIKNGQYPFLHASLDGELIDQKGRRGILEIKTTNLLQGSQREKWKERIPDHYYIQILHYLLVTNYDFAILKAQLKSKWKGEITLSTRHYFIERSEVEEDMMYLLHAEQRFWKQVKEKKKPNLILPEI